MAVTNYRCPRAQYVPGVDGQRRLYGSVGAANKLARVHRQALLMITGALRSTATDALEAHSDILPFRLLIDKLCQRAAVRLCTLPDSHPLARHVRRASRRYVRHHRSPLHEILHAYDLHPAMVETIHPARHHPSWQPVFRIHIPPTKDAALDEEDSWDRRSNIRIYSGGSDHDGGVGAAAVLLKAGRPGYKVLRCYLGSSNEHSVYEAEIVGELLGLELLRRETKVTRTSIAADNKATIQASALRKSSPGHYLLDALHSAADRAHRKHRHLDLTLRWIPGHEGIHGNELADRAAKKAAAKQSSDPSLLPSLLRRHLPISSSKLKQSHAAALKSQAKTLWQASPRARRLRPIDSSLPDPAYGRMVQDLPRRRSSLLTQLRTGHAPLNEHLHRIGTSPSPRCPRCDAPRETVVHFLLACPAYRRQRQRLLNKLGRKATSLRGLLSSPKSLDALFEYTMDTGRFNGPAR